MSPKQISILARSVVLVAFVLLPLVSLRVQAAPRASDELVWVRTGGPLGGLGYDIRMRPDNPDSMLVTDAWAGVFISSDGGLSWSASSVGITTRAGPTGDAIPVFCLTLDPNDYNIVWAGTQNTRGIFKSVDGGRSWQKMDSGVTEKDGITFRGVAVEPGSSNVAYAAAEIASWIWNNGEYRAGREFEMVGGVVYKTTDGGLNWKKVWQGDNLARYIWIDPRNTDVVYVSTGIFDREAANSDPGAGTPGGEGVLKSTDGGRTWTHVNAGLRNLYVGSLFMHPINPDILLAGTGNNQYHAGAGVYLSTDGGASWQQTLFEQIVASVEFSAANPDIAYAGSSEAIFRSDDGGRNWQQVSGGGGSGWGSPGVRAGFPIDFQVDPRDPDRLFANEYGGGNFLSEDGGRTWVDASRGYTGAQVRDIAVDPTAPGRVIAAARSGIFVSNDGGGEWEGLSYPPVVTMEWNVVAIDPADPQHVLASTNWDSPLVDSHDGGRSWRKVMGSPGERMGWRAMAFAPSDSSIVYAGTAGFYSAGSFSPEMPARGVYFSRDGGLTWLSTNDALVRDAHVTALAVEAGNPQAIWAATTNHGLLKSGDGGQRWASPGNGLPASAPVLSVALSPADPNTIFAGLQGRAVYRSADGGDSWQRSATGLAPESAVSDIVFDPANPLEVLYLSDLFSGVYRSIDGGKSWTPIGAELLTRAVNALALSNDGQHLYAATEGGGVYRLDLNGVPPSTATTQATAVPTGSAPATTSPAGATQPAVPSPTPTPKPAGGGLCGAAALPLALVGLLWLRRRKSQREQPTRPAGK